MELNSYIVSNLAIIIAFFIVVGYYKGKVETLSKDNESIHKKMDAYHRRADVHGDDIVRLNTKAELAMTAKEVDEKYVSKELFRQFEKHIDGRFDGIDTSLSEILSYIKKDR